MRVRLAVSLVVCGASVLGAQGVRVNFEAWREPVLMDTLRQDHDLKSTPEKVYEATLKAFAALDIPIGNTSGKAGIIGSERFQRMRTLGGALLSKSFNCGEGPTGPKADSYRLQIAVVAYVSPVPGGSGTRLGLATVAEGRDPTGPYGNPRECGSTGALEVKLLNRITLLSGG
jgi:hypothetical protein